MRRTELLQEIWKVRFDDAYGGRQSGRLTQEEAASVLGVRERTSRRYLGAIRGIGAGGSDRAPAGEPRFPT